MAYSFTDLSQTLKDRRTADNVLVMARHALRDADEGGGEAFEWRTSGSFLAGADATASGFPTTRLHDGIHNLPTKPDSAVATWYLILDVAAANLATIDHIFIGGTNFATAGVTTVNFQIADDSAFTVSLVTIATFTPTLDGREIELDLDHTATGAQVYSDVQFMRLEIIMGVADTPEVSELITAERIQFPTSPLVEYDPDMQVSEVSTFTARSGAQSRYVFHRGKSVLAGSLLLKGSTDAQLALDWWQETKNGTESFVWLECPGTAETKGLVYLMEPQFIFPHITSEIRRLAFDMTASEQPEFFEIEQEGTPAFNASAQPGLQRDYDPGAITGLNDGDTLVTVPDSANSVDLDTLVVTPTFETNEFNGFAGAQFIAEEGIYNAADAFLDGVAGASMYIVFKTTSSGANKNEFLFSIPNGSTTDSFDIFYNRTNGLLRSFLRSNTTTTDTGAVGTAINDGAVHIAELHFDPTLSTLEHILVLDGVTIGSQTNAGATITAPSDTPSMGTLSGVTPGSNGYNGLIARVLIYVTAHAPAVQATTRQGLSDKYGGPL